MSRSEGELIAVVVSTADDVSLHALPWLDRMAPPPRFVVAADGGVDVAHALGLRVDVAVGDFDSVTEEGLRRAQAEGARVERHPESKEATDLSLALDVALREGAREIVVVGAGGGRFDHLLAGVLALTAGSLADVRVSALLGGARIHVVRPGPPVRVHGRPGEVLTLVPVGGPATGVGIDGVRYPLTGDELAAGTTRGVSNVLESEIANVRIGEGVVLAVLPGEPR